jgi:hypothetical protein
MPYIPSDDKMKFDAVLTELCETIDTHGISNGELNYLITMLGIEYIGRHGESYNTLSDVIKAFECAKLEFYRRKMVPYEDAKIASNGDVYSNT